MRHFLSLAGAPSALASGMQMRAPAAALIAASGAAQRLPPTHTGTRSSAVQIAVIAVSTELHRLRWQIELLFKEWKSHANLRAFSTAKPAIVEGLIWAAIVVAAVKRYLAHSAQIIAEVATSTLRTARCAWQVIPAIVEALLSCSPRRLRAAFMRAIEYLALNAQRAHPHRDRRSGRLATGLKPVLRAA